MAILSLSATPTVFQSSVIFLLLCMLVNAYHDYCIIGAGPSGLQMGYFFQRAARDYVIYEKSNVSGNFFVQYPRHRTLISLNKRYTGKTNKEFNLRHDWNSLISDDESLKFTRYSKDIFPHADRYLEYLHDYQQKLGINVQFNTEISNIKREPCENAPDLHVFTMLDQRGSTHRCGRLIVATGIAKPVIPDIPGMEYTDGYEDISMDRDEFEGQTVLILGRGNSAFETATHIYGSTNLIHMVGRSRVRLSWATHYVGDLRAVNNQLLDTYQLKSLDGVVEASISEVKIVKNKKDGKLHLAMKEEDEDSPDPQEIIDFDNFAMREPYDRIIRCLGFKFDEEIFNQSMKFTHPRGRTSKFLSIHPNYESVDYPGMFIAGTASHSLDFRKSAGGFIHGYRYTARALFHLLDWRYHSVPWPSITAPNSQLMDYILKRINEGSGIYQMFSMLGDVIILNENGTFKYLEEFPIHMIHKLSEMTGHAATRVIVLNLQYGAGFSGPGNDVFRSDRATGDPSEAHTSNFLHPCFYYYETLPSEKHMKAVGRKEHLPRPNMLHHIVEDFLTTWNAPLSHILPLRRFFETIFSTDLRQHYAESCMEMALTHTSLPYHCAESYMRGEGLTVMKS